jgi:hypothetical protein
MLPSSAAWVGAIWSERCQEQKGLQCRHAVFNDLAQAGQVSHKKIRNRYHLQARLFPEFPK